MTSTIKTSRKVIVRVPGRAMSNLDILYYVDKIQLPNFVGVYMRDTLPNKSWNRNTPQFGIMNLNKSNQPGVHWVAWAYIPNNGVYNFDSFGSDVPIELLKYLKTKEELAKNKGLIQQNMWNLSKGSEGKLGGRFPGVSFIEGGQIVSNDGYWVGYFNCLFDRINQKLLEQHNFNLNRKIQRIGLNAQNDNHYTEFHVDQKESTFSIVGFFTPQWAEEWGGELNIE